MSVPYLIPERNPRSGRPNLLIYSSCHTYGILKYIDEYRPEVREQYNISAVVIHLAAGCTSALQDRGLLDSFHSADFLLHHPLASDKWTGFRAEEIGLKPSCLRVAMGSPHLNCLWPLHSTTPESESPVRKMIAAGMGQAEIIQVFDAGEVECNFNERLKIDLDGERRRETNWEIKYVDFIENNLRMVKLFFSPNHPAMAIIAHMTDQFLERLGHVRKGSSHALSLPPETMLGDNHFPETQYEFEHYRFWYPRRFEHNMGGRKFYHNEIARICGKC